MQAESALLRVFALVHGVDAYVDGLFCEGTALGSQCVHWMLLVRNKTFRAHAKELCRVQARALLSVAPTWGWPVPVLAREVVAAVALQVPACDLGTQEVAALVDLYTRTGHDRVCDLLQAAVQAASTVDEMRAKHMLAAGVCEVCLTPYLALCQNIATAARRYAAHGVCAPLLQRRVRLQQDVARALRLRQKQQTATDVVPRAVLVVLAACARIDWREAHSAGIFRPLLDFVRVHARDIPVGSVQGRVFLRDAARAWNSRGPAVERTELASAEFLEMYTNVLHGQCARLRSSNGCVDAEASLVLHAVQRIAATPPCLALRVCLTDLWEVIQSVQELSLSTLTPHTPTVLALLDAHAHMLLSAQYPGLPALPAASLHPCRRVRMGPRAVVRALEHVIALHAVRAGVSDQYALIALAGHLVREAGLSTFIGCQFAVRLEPLATTAAALLLRSAAARAPGPMPVASKQWDVLVFVNSCLNKFAHGGGGLLAPAWQRCLRDVAEALEAFAVHAASAAFAPLLPPAYAFTRQTVTLLHSGRIHSAHVPPVLLGHVLGYVVAEPAAVLMSAAAILHTLQRRHHPVVSHELLMPFFAQLGTAPCTEDTRHLLVLVAARLCRAHVHASVCLADLVATLLPRMQPRVVTLAGICKALFAAVLAQAPLCRHMEHLHVLLAHATALEGQVCEREAYYRLRIVLLCLAQTPGFVCRQLAPVVLGLLLNVQTHALATPSRRVQTLWLDVFTTLLREGVPSALLPECKQLVLAACGQELASVHSHIALQALVAQAIACELRAAVRGPCATATCAPGRRSA